ncbi:MAG: CoB--CoM heterodisulfide reductase iron-sulfur subunit A family protein, partial [Candidatus Hermodarchaeota archaeon]
KVDVDQNGTIKTFDVGAIIVAVGSSLLDAKGILGYDGNKRITQYELESMLKNKEIKEKDFVMIQCAGSRNEERPYCSSVCCMTALKNALNIKELNPETHVTILFRDLYTPGTSYEEYYRKAR